MQRILLTAWIAATVLLIPAGMATAQESARWAPADALIWVGTDDFAALAERFRATPTYDMITSEAMAPFVKDAKQRISARLSEGLQQWELGDRFQERLESLPWPTGRVGLVMRTVMRMRKMRMLPEGFDWRQTRQEDFDWERMDELMVDREVPETMPVVAFWAEIGPEAAQWSDFVAELIQAAQEQGTIAIEEQLAGVTVTRLSLPAWDGDVVDDEEVFYYGFIGETLVGGTDAALLGDVLRCMQGYGDHLAGQEMFRHAMANVGPGEAAAFVNLAGWLEIADSGVPAEQRAEMAQFYRLFGFHAFQGLGLSVQLAAGGPEEMRLRGFVAMPDGPAGLVGAFLPENAPVRLNRLLSAGLESFIMAQYDFVATYDAIENTFSHMHDSMGVNPMMMLEGSLAMTGDPATGLPPVSLRNDILGRMSGPLVYAVRPGEGDNDPSQGLLGISVREPELLEAALARIHRTFIGRGNAQLEREFLNTKLYLLGGAPMNMMFMTPGAPMPDADEQAEPAGGFALVEDFFVAGPVAPLEQVIRNLRREDFDGVQTDEMFQLAAAVFPHRAAIVSYQNDKLALRTAWRQYQRLAETTARYADLHGDDDYWSDSPPRPEVMFLEMFSEYCDFSLLPPFERIERYAGATVSYAERTSDGVFGELISLVPEP